MAADSKARFLQDAERYVLQGRVQQAIGEYLKIIKFDPNDILILNTVGDLYLRQNNVTEANKYFAQVAESYVRDNFFLKAIAVYKKILATDPDNLQINSTIASLYAKQGLSMEARNHYMKVAALLERENRTREGLEIYEKIVELDPGNAAVQRKLAEMFSSSGDAEQAHTYWNGAARAQLKAGDVKGAMDSVQRAIELKPLDLNAIGIYVECCRKAGDLQPVLEHLKKCVHTAPQNLDLREMLGQAYMAMGDPENAVKAFEVVFSIDEARYEGFFAASQTWMERGEFDQAVRCLDTIIPVLITRRETERAAELFRQILRRDPKHVPTLVAMASIYSATGDCNRHMETLDALADLYLEAGEPAQALECLEKILGIKPDSEKHRKLHENAFAAAYPGTPYLPPEPPAETAAVPDPIPIPKKAGETADATLPEIVEADLLLNYGLKEKALKLLQGLEIREPANREMRLRLMHLYKADNRYTDAARQCLLLAALCRLSSEENAAQEYLAEARQMVPDMEEYNQDLIEYARLNGIVAEEVPSSTEEAMPFSAEEEVDISGDLMDIFFTSGSDQETGSDLHPGPEMPADVAIEASPDTIQQTPARSFQEQLQEVDFYLRLGFHDEAATKLNELARLDPGNPELAPRYQKLQEVTSGRPAEAVEEAAPFAGHEFDVSDTAVQPQTDLPSTWDEKSDLGGFEILESMQSAPESEQDLSVDLSFPSADSFGSWNGEEARSMATAPEPIAPDFQVNEMFADLMDEAGSSAVGDLSMDAFENHFSLGTAYREMDLWDDAIKEFESAWKIACAHKDAGRIVQCCGMLSTCCLKKGMARTALRWCQAGLSVADNSSHEALALRYDMGVAYTMSGSPERAFDCFDGIFGVDPSYRDVAQKLDELKSGLK